MDIASEPGQVATLCQLRPVWRKGRAHSSVMREREKNQYVTEVALSHFIREQATTGDDHHSLAILTPAQEPLASPSRVFSFESQLKPEERRKEVEPKMEAKSTRWGARQPPSSSSGLAACAGLVWKIPPVEAKHLGKQVPARVGLVGLRGCTASVNSNHTQEQGARFWVSEGVCSHQAAAVTGAGQGCSPWVKPSGTGQAQCCQPTLSQGTASLLPRAHVGVDGHTVVGSVAELLLTHFGTDIVWQEEGAGAGGRLRQCICGLVAQFVWVDVNPCW